MRPNLNKLPWCRTVSTCQISSTHKKFILIKNVNSKEKDPMCISLILSFPCKSWGNYSSNLAEPHCYLYQLCTIYNDPYSFQTRFISLIWKDDLVPTWLQKAE